MKTPWPSLLMTISLVLKLSSRKNSVLSFSSSMAARMNAAISTSTSTVLREKARNGDSSNNRKKSTVAIIGGGIAGLSCARHLQHSYDVTVVS